MVVERCSIHRALPDSTCSILLRVGPSGWLSKQTRTEFHFDGPIAMRQQGHCQGHEQMLHHHRLSSLRRCAYNLKGIVHHHFQVATSSGLRIRSSSENLDMARTEFVVGLGKSLHRQPVEEILDRATADVAFWENRNRHRTPPGRRVRLRVQPRVSRALQRH